MINQQNKQLNSNIEMDDLQRIRMLETRMRSKGKQIPVNQQSVRSIKSTDSRKVNPYKNKMIVLEQQRSDPNHQHSNQNIKINPQQQVKNNHKITQYFTIKHTAKKQQSGNQDKQQKYPLKIGTLVIQPVQLNLELSSNPIKSNMSTQEAIKEQNKNLKEKLRIKQQSFLALKNKMKKDLVQSVIQVHKLKRNQMKVRVSHNKIRLGEFHVQKKGGDFWSDGIQIRQVKQKIQAIYKQRDEIQKCKKIQAKKSNKQFSQDPQQSKNTLQSQLYFLARQQQYLQQTLKRLDEQKMIHIKQYKLLYDQQHSKYGKGDQQNAQLWPKIGQYQLLCLLGKGGFSQVYKAYDTQQLRQVACKLHQLSPQWNTQVKQNFIKHAMRQQGVHKMLNHTSIVKLFGTVQIDQNAFCTILQYCQGPDLSFYLKKHKRLPEKQAKMLIKQVINAIKYLHELPEKVIHYDLKPQNILFHKGRIKITDFGLCKITNQERLELTSQGVGTYWYLPPECFVTDQKPIITTKVDIWSIGVIYFEMLYGEKPFGNQMSQLRVLSQGIMLKANNVNFPNHAKCVVSNESKQFIKACLRANQQQRLDIKGVSMHPLFEKR